MSATERVVQSILYELGCVLIGCLVMQFVPHEGQPLVLMIIFSLLAMVWNFVFNWIFDKLVPGMTLVILGYTYIYNWVYDRARLYFVEA
ncbi:MAG: chlorhexidine efflux transporter [Veillonella sp.]|nr:chlorhexidine efflux transporter [Veillonella sp.]